MKLLLWQAAALAAFLTSFSLLHTCALFLLLFFIQTIIDCAE